MDVQQLDTWIREGRSRLARRVLEQHFRENGFARLSRPLRLELARIARRAGLPLAAVRLLHSVVRPGPRVLRVATPAEQSEYAASLAQIGADAEALKILDSLDSAGNPEILLFRAFARFPRWDYSAAIPLLERYLAVQNEPYPRLVGLINLAAALVAIDAAERAIPLLEALIEEASKGGHQLLVGNALLLKAEALVEREQWREAARLLKAAAEHSKEVASLDALYVDKWSAILRLKETGGSKEALLAVDRVRRRAAEARNGETLRDLDFHQAVVTNDGRLFARAYWGTPYPEYRRRLEKFPLRAQLPQRPSWVSGTSMRPAEIDFFEGGLKPGQLLWRLSGCLVSDAYRSFRLAAIHAALFPERHFHPLHSPNVVHQAVRRLRQHLAAQNTPLSLREESGSYRLFCRRSARLFLPRDSSATPARLQLDRFLMGRKRGPFGRRELELALGLSERAAAYLLSEAVAKGWVVAEGGGRARTYRAAEQKSLSRS